MLHDPPLPHTAAGNTGLPDGGDCAMLEEDPGKPARGSFLRTAQAC